MSIAEENCRFGGGTNRVRAFLESTPALVVDLHAKRPRAGEVWRAGSVRFIDWNCALPFGRTDRVTIEVSLNGAAGPWRPIAASRPNNGRFQWRVPNWPTVKNAMLRFTVGGQSFAGNRFTILGSAARVE